MISVPGPLVEIRSQPPTGAIVLNRPAKGNALTRGMLGQIAQGLDDLHQEHKVRAVVLTGDGPAFCAGLDVQEILNTSEQENAWEVWHADALLYEELLEKMLRFPKPIIAAVNGPALASGAGLVLASDLVLGTSNSMIGLTQPRLGLVAGIIAPLLSFRLGASHAANLLLTGRSIAAAEAFRIGLMHEVVGEDQLFDRACELCEEISQCAPSAIQLTKRMLNETIGEQLFTLLSAGAAAGATSLTTEAAAEGLKAFAEKREPKWE